MKSLQNPDLARAYDVWHGKHSAEERIDSWTLEFFDWILGLLAPAPGASLLDVACGSCTFLRFAAERGFDPTGIDISPAAIAIAAERVPGVDLRVGEAEQLPFPDSSFDVVTCLGSLEHFESPERGAAEIARVLRPSGRAVVFVPNLFFLGHVWFGLRHGTQPSEGGQEFSETFRSSKGWLCLLGRAGLSVERWEPWNKIHASVKVSRVTMRLWNAAARFVPRHGSYAFAFVCRKAAS
jgi:SAM-dependent methyltransferase